MTTMTTEMIMMKLAAIRGKSNGQPIINASDDRSSDEVCEDAPVNDTDPEPTGSATDDSDEHISSPIETESNRVNSQELIELAMKWGAEISQNGFLIENKIGMTRKDYLKHIKSLTQESLLSDPLLYVLFRAEEQGDANFFQWIERFPKDKK